MRLNIKDGSTRTSIIFGSLVIKIPRILPWLKLLFVHIPRMLFTGRFKFLSYDIRHVYSWFKRAINQNRSEYETWKKSGAKFLSPVYFSVFGIINVSKFIEGDNPSYEEWLSVLKALPKDAIEYLLGGVDPHSFYSSNIIKNRDNFIFVDYGEGSERKYSLSHFLFKWKKELERLLIRRV